METPDFSKISLRWWSLLFTYIRGFEMIAMGSVCKTFRRFVLKHYKNEKSIFKAAIWYQNYAEHRIYVAMQLDTPVLLCVNPKLIKTDLGFLILDPIYLEYNPDLIRVRAVVYAVGQMPKLFGALCKPIYDIIQKIIWIRDSRMTQDDIDYLDAEFKGRWISYYAFISGHPDFWLIMEKYTNFPSASMKHCEILTKMSRNPRKFQIRLQKINPEFFRRYFGTIET